MDWCFGSKVDEFAISKEQETSDRFPSPESWPKWGISESESFDEFVIDSKLTREELNFNLLNEVEVQSSPNDEDQSSSGIGGASLEYLQQTALLCDQLDGLAGFEHTDDLFLYRSSFVEDSPGNENLHRLFCFEPELLNCMVEDDDIRTDSILDAQSISSDVYSMGSSKDLKTNAFFPSVDPDEGKVSAYQPFIPSNSDQKNSPLIQAPLIKALAPSKRKRINEHVDEETSLEEFVLQELAMVMTQLTDKTRIGFRDAFYRLADNSSQHVTTCYQHGTLSMETTWTGQEDKIRPGGQKPMVDRALANLMFNNMDFNLHDFHVSSSEKGRLEATCP